MSSRRQFGRVRKLPSGRYQARYLDPRNNKDTPAPSTFATKSEATRWLATVEADLSRGELLDQRQAKRSFSDWSQEWLDGLQVKASTYQQYESSLRVHVLPEFGHRWIGSISHTECASFIVGLEAKGHGPSVIANARKVLRLVFALAERSDAIRRNPAAGLQVKRGAKDEMTFLTPGEVERLARAIESPPRPARHQERTYPEYALIVRLAAWTGLRAGEICALRVGRVNPLLGRIEVAESADDRTGQVLFGPPKTYQRRSVPVPRTLALELSAHLATRPSSPDALVFTAPEGGPLCHRNFYRRHFRPAVERSVVPASMRFHDLRHTAAALMVAEGAHALAIKERLGHSSITVTMDRYGHLFPSLEAALTDRLDIAYAEARHGATA